MVRVENQNQIEGAHHFLLSSSSAYGAENIMCRKFSEYLYLGLG